MAKRLNPLIHAYAILLCLYPESFRAEFADEMQSVFKDALIESARRGKRRAVLWCAYEFRSLLVEATRAHWQKRRDQIMTNHSTRTETLLALSPFFIGVASLLAQSLASILPDWANGMMAILLLGAVASLFLAGLFTGLPRWALPNMGLALTLLAIFIYPWIAEGLPRNGLYSWMYVGIFWLCLLAMALLAVGVIAVIPFFRPLWNRMRQDWTLLSFSLYGTGVFALILAFEEYRGDEPYIFAGLLGLAAGVWAYLNSRNSWQRILALLAGLALALAVAAIGKWIIRPYQAHWPPSLLTDANRLNEVRSTIELWIWVVAIVLAPSLLELLPRRPALLPDGQG